MYHYLSLVTFVTPSSDIDRTIKVTLAWHYVSVVTLIALIMELFHASMQPFILFDTITADTLSYFFSTQKRYRYVYGMSFNNLSPNIYIILTLLSTAIDKRPLHNGIHGVNTI